jgi:hypothetical protein
MVESGSRHCPPRVSLHLAFFIITCISVCSNLWLYIAWDLPHVFQTLIRRNVGFVKCAQLPRNLWCILMPTGPDTRTNLNHNEGLTLLVYSLVSGSFYVNLTGLPICTMIDVCCAGLLFAGLGALLHRMPLALLTLVTPLLRGPVFLQMIGGPRFLLYHSTCNIMRVTLAFYIYCCLLDFLFGSNVE